MQVWARDPDRVRRGLLTPVSVQCVLRESGVGTWAITVDETSQWSPKIEPGWGVIVVDDDGTTLFSGPAKTIAISQQGQTRDVELTGVTDMTLFTNRGVLPDPSKIPEQQTAGSHYKAKGPAETVILDLLAGQCTPDPAWPTAYRTAKGLVLPASLGRGATISVESRYKGILEEIQALATLGGLVLDVVQDGGDLALTVREPVDRSRSVRFMPDAGLGDYSMSLTAPTATTVILLGAGEGTARNVRTGSRPVDEMWGGELIEVFVDRRDTTDTDEYAKTIAEALEEGAPSSSASFTVEENGDQRFGTHYRLGDTVTVALPGGGEITDGLRVADITWSEFTDGNTSTRDVKLTVGEHSTEEDQAPAWVKRQRDLMRRIRHLEVSQ